MWAGEGAEVLQEAGALAATLSIMIGGKANAVERAMPIFEKLGKNIVHVGDAGAGQVTKAANQMVVGTTIAIVGEALVLAAKAGAAYISPFMGRLDDIGQNGLQLVADIVEIYSNYDWKTQVLAASVRNPIHVVETARAGADVATMPFKVMAQLIQHPLTDKGLQQFLADWRKAA